MHLIYCIKNVTALSYHVNVAIKLSIYIVAIYMQIYAKTV